MSAGETIANAARLGSSRKLAILLLVLLLAADIALIWLHILWGYDHWVWDVGADTGYAENFQYLKWAAAAAFLLALAWKRRGAIYAVWAALFLYLLVDDSQSVHERSGTLLVNLLDLRAFEEFYHRNFEYFFLQAQDFGELIFALALGAVIAVVVCVFWPGREATRERAVTKRLIGWVLLFAFFAVGVDMLHVMAWEIYPPAIEPLAVIEDGGEMICASILVGGLALELARS